MEYRLAQVRLVILRPLIRFLLRNGPPLSTATLASGEPVAGENPPPQITGVMMDRFLYHVNRNDDLSCRNTSTQANTPQSDVTVADLDQFITEKACFTARVTVKEEQRRN